MPLSPADFYAYSQATGAPIADTPEKRAQQATQVLAFQENRLKAPKEGPGLLDILGGAALIAGTAAGGYGIARALRNRNVAQAATKVSVEDVTPQAAQNVRRAAAAYTQPRPSAAPTPSRVPTAAPTAAPTVRETPPPTVRQTPLLPGTNKPNLGIQMVDIRDLMSSVPAVKTEQGPRLLPAARTQVQPYPTAAAQTGTPYSLRDIGELGLSHMEVAPELDVADRLLREYELGRQSRQASRIKAAQQDREMELRGIGARIMDQLKGESLVDQQNAQLAQHADQLVNAVNSAEDQMTGRMKHALQQNPHLDMSQVEVLEDMAEHSYRQGMEQDEPINAAAAQMTGRVPNDQAEGIDLKTGSRFALNTTASRTGLGPGQRIQIENQPVNTAGFVKNFIAKQRENITSQLNQEGVVATPGKIEKELASRLGPESYTYGSDFTKLKQAMEVGLEDPRYLEAASLSTMPNTRMVGGTEFDVNVKDVMEDDPELAFRKPFISEQTAISSEQNFIDKQNQVKDWLGNIRLEIIPQINSLTKHQEVLGEQHNMLLYSLRQRPNGVLGQQLKNVANQMRSNESELNFLNSRLAGATNSANEQLEELSKWTPSTLIDWSGEGTVVRPKRTAPDTMSFEAEGGELSNIERGASMAQPGPDDLEIVPGGLLSGGRAKVVSNIGQDIGFDPETGERLLVPLVDADTGENIIQKLAGKQIGEDIGVRGRGGSAGMGTNASIGIYGAELGSYGTAAQTKTGAYTQEASQVPSLVNSEPVPRRSGGFFTHPQQREANPTKYAQTLTPQRQESVRLSEAVRKGQMQLPQMQGPTQSPGDPSKYFEYNLWDKFNKVTPQSPVQLSFSSDIVPPIAEARTTAADIATQQLEAYMSKLQRGRSTPFSSEVVIQPKLFEAPGSTQMFLPLAGGQQRTINTGTIKPAVLKPIRAQGQRQAGPLAFQPNLLF